MTPDAFGTTADGRPVRRLVLGREPGPVLHLLDLGATVHRLEVTGGDGVRRNVALGLPTAQAHLDSRDYLGGTVGRYANRIAGGRFLLDGREVPAGGPGPRQPPARRPGRLRPSYVGGGGSGAVPRGARAAQPRR